MNQVRCLDATVGTYIQICSFLIAYKIQLIIPSTGREQLQVSQLSSETLTSLEHWYSTHSLTHTEAAADRRDRDALGGREDMMARKLHGGEKRLTLLGGNGPHPSVWMRRRQLGECGIPGQLIVSMREAWLENKGAETSITVITATSWLYLLSG